ILSDGKRKLLRVEPKTGNVKWSADIPGRRKLESSPTVGGGRVYIMNFGGDVTVVDAAKGDVLSTVSMGDPGDDMIRSSIPLSHGQLFIRTNKKLYCIGK